MGLKIVWTDLAIENLQNIFKYYKDEVNKETAQKIVIAIVDKTIYLETNPEIGQREELLKTRTKEFRYLVEGNYKVIYWMEGKVIFVATVFDTRQNPKKLLRIK